MRLELISETTRMQPLLVAVHYACPHPTVKGGRRWEGDSHVSGAGPSGLVEWAGTSGSIAERCTSIHYHARRWCDVGLQVVFLGTPDVAARALEILLQASEEGK